MSVGKDFRFPVSVCWQGEKFVRAEAPDIGEIEVAVPPEFGGPDGYLEPGAPTRGGCCELLLGHICRSREAARDTYPRVNRYRNRPRRPTG